MNGLYVDEATLIKLNMSNKVRIIILGRKIRKTNLSKLFSEPTVNFSLSHGKSGSENIIPIKKT